MCAVSNMNQHNDVHIYSQYVMADSKENMIKQRDEEMLIIRLGISLTSNVFRIFLLFSLALAVLSDTFINEIKEF